MPRLGARTVWAIAGAVIAVGALLAACAQIARSQEPKLAAGETIPERPDYNWDVRPILSQNCFQCHGNNTQKAGLRLDLAKAAYAQIPEDRSRRAIVPGNPGGSELIRRVTA